MEVPGVRMEIQDNVESEPHIGRRVGELKEFLLDMPDDALIVFAANKPGHPLLLVKNSNKRALFVSESTELSDS